MPNLKFTLAILAGLIIALPLVIASYVCPDNNQVKRGESPCEVLSPPELDCSDDAFIIDLLNNTRNYTIAMNLKYPSTNTYNFSFNYSDLGFYLVELCDNTTATLYIYDPEVSSTTIYAGASRSRLTSDLVEDIPSGELTREQIYSFFKNFWYWIADLARKYWFFVILGVFLFLGWFGKNKFKNKELKKLQKVGK